MFKDWPEYVYHIIDSLVPDEKNRAACYRKMDKWLKIYVHQDAQKAFCRAMVNTVLSNDWDFTKLTNFNTNPQIHNYKTWRKGVIHPNNLKNPYIPEESKLQIAKMLEGKPRE